MKNVVIALGLATLFSNAAGQVLGKAIPLRQTGICQVLGCTQLKEVQISPRLKYVEGRKANQDDYATPGGGVAAFYVDGKLAALGWQEVFNYDSKNIGLAELNQLARIGVGAAAPRALQAYDSGFGIDSALGGKRFVVKNGIFKSANTGDRRGILLIDQKYFQIVNSAIGRDDRKAGLWFVQDFFKRYGIKAVKVSPYEYRATYSPALYNQAQQYFVGFRKLENHACCGHPGRLFTLQGLSATEINFLPEDRDNPRFVSIEIGNRR